MPQATLFRSYDPMEMYDELFEARQVPRPAATRLSEYLDALGPASLFARQQSAQSAIRNQGITFTVYSEKDCIDREWPFDIIPRIIDKREWESIEAGLSQRLTALNMFIDDLYGAQRVVKDGVFPAEVLASSRNFRKECCGIRPPLGIWAHICGSDLVRDRDGTVYVLEDNLRVPSGVSYMLENRMLTKRVFPELFDSRAVQPVDGYAERLLTMLRDVAPAGLREPHIVVLTPGVYNSAYFEHCFLAQELGVPLVEGCDLVVEGDDQVYMKTIGGLERVDVIYRRVDDLFLDPEIFDSGSMLGCPGLMRAWAAGTVSLVNAPGAGVADDKVVYSYVPDLIRYYLAQDPILPNVPTLRCFNTKERLEVLGNMHNYVVKPANESGGYGVMVGDRASADELRTYGRLIETNPREYIAQPIISLSTAPTLCEDTVEPRHLDLRPFILNGKDTYVTRGGLTRVALQRGSLVVNSSQGGGSKDTWVIDTEQLRLDTHDNHPMEAAHAAS